VQQNQQFQDICVNRPYAPLQEDEDAMDPNLPKEQQVDDEEGVAYEDDSEDDKDYIWGGHFEPVEEGSFRETKAKDIGDDKSLVSDEPDLYDYVYSNLPDDVHILKPIDDCKKCGAKRFQYETKGFYCRDGQVKLAEQETPPKLMRLSTSSNGNAKHFHDDIRWFDSHFSFISLYCSLDQDTTDLRKHPIYIFRAHGQMYHNIHGFGKQDGIDLSHLELYFYDDDPALEHHFRKYRMNQQENDRGNYNVSKHTQRQHLL
jgi:hypothetical protein